MEGSRARCQALRGAVEDLERDEAERALNTARAEQVGVDAEAGANFEADPGRLVVVFKDERACECLEAGAEVEREFQ